MYPSFGKQFFTKIVKNREKGCTFVTNYNVKQDETLETLFR